MSIEVDEYGIMVTGKESIAFYRLLTLSSGGLRVARTA
jgi:hypothetical protein